MGLLRMIEYNATAYFLNKVMDEACPEKAAEKVGEQLDEITAKRYGEKKSEHMQGQFILLILAFTIYLCKYLAKDWTEELRETYNEKISELVTKLEV